MLGNNGAKENVDGDTFDTWHTYEIDWQPDYINWSVDGEVRRTLNKSSTWNATANRFEFPQTPSRLQMSLWPAGIPSNGEGTIEWAGGMVDWDSTDIQKYGYYYATYGEISIQCYQPPSGANVQGDKSYIYTDNNGLNSSIEITNKDTVLSSFGATGTNMTIGASTGTSTATGSASTASSSDTVPANHGGTGNTPGNSGSSSSSSGGSGSSSSNGGATTTGFSQGGSSTDSSKSGAPIQNERVLQSSLFAVLVAVVVLVTL